MWIDYFNGAIPRAGMRLAVACASGCLAFLPVKTPLHKHRECTTLRCIFYFFRGGSVC